MACFLCGLSDVLRSELGAVSSGGGARVPCRLFPVPLLVALLGLALPILNEEHGAATEGSAVRITHSSFPGKATLTHHGLPDGWQETSITR